MDDILQPIDGPDLSTSRRLLTKRSTCVTAISTQCPALALQILEPHLRAFLPQKCAASGTAELDARLDARAIRLQPGIRATYREAPFSKMALQLRQGEAGRLSEFCVERDGDGKDYKIEKRHRRIQRHRAAVSPSFGLVPRKMLSTCLKRRLVHKRRLR